MQKTIKVMLPISVSDSVFCFNVREGVRCPNFNSGDCSYGFSPRFEKGSEAYLKDKKCSSLIWQENIK